MLRPCSERSVHGAQSLLDRRIGRKRVTLVNGLTRQHLTAALVVAGLLGACSPDVPSEDDSAPPTAALTEESQPPGLDPQLAALELARVEGQTITLGQLHDFFADMPEVLLSETTGVERVRRHLQTLIDMELLKLAAVDRGIDRSDVFIDKVEGHRRPRLVGLYLMAKIDARPTVQEVGDYYNEQGLSRRVRFGRIVVASQDSLRGALDDLTAGSSFQEVAAMWSLDEETAPRGGDTGRYINRLELPPTLSDELFTLQVGELSAPIAFGSTYGIYTILDEVEAPLDQGRFKDVYQALAIERSNAARRVLVDSLRQAFDLRIDRAAAEAVVAAARDRDTDALQHLTLVRYRGGQITGRDLLEMTPPAERDALGQSVTEVIARLEGKMVPEVLLLEAAVDEGIGEDETTRAWLARKRDEELIVQLRVQVLDERVSISDAEVLQEYESNRGRYTRPERLTLQEVLVATEAEAQKIRERVEGGEDMGDLAAAHSLRPAPPRDAAGRLTVTLGDGRIFGRLVSNAWQATMGELVGPVAVHEGFTVFRVLSRHKEPATFAEAERRVRATVRWLKKQVVFDEFVQELRAKYADRVQIREDHLSQAVAAG